MKLLSIIIVNIKGKENLPRLLQSLSLSIFKDFEIIVIDDVKNESLNNIKTIYINEDRGPAYCRNIGARNSEGKFLLFLDNDTKVPDNSLGHLINFLSSNPYKIVQLKLIREDGTIDSAGGFIDDLGYPYEKYRGERSENVNSIYPILYAKSAALAISRDVFDNLGGFDEDYFFGYEETDLCFRAWKLGYEVVFLPVNIIHYEHGSYSNNHVEKERRLVYFLESRRLYFIHKNYNAKFLLKKLPFVYYYYLGSVIMDIVKRKNVNLFLGRVKALLWFFTKIPEIMRKRMIKKKYVRSEKDLEKLGLIISHKNNR